ncbi:MAG: hypothetical protein LBR22_09265 [Desulfovibrio sp.]|nr:hypothetical protein [Desulfovibrio sp.]
MTVRHATPDDFPALVALRRRSVLATHDFLSPAEVDAIAPDMTRLLPTLETWTARDGHDRVTGFPGMAGNRVETRFVEPSLRGRGIGTAPPRPRQGSAGGPGPGRRRTESRVPRLPPAAGIPADGAGRPFPLLHMRLEGAP